jgi:hypothetical protein
MQRGRAAPRQLRANKQIDEQTQRAGLPHHEVPLTYWVYHLPHALRELNLALHVKCPRCPFTAPLRVPVVSEYKPMFYLILQSILYHI